MVLVWELVLLIKKLMHELHFFIYILFFKQSHAQKMSNFTKDRANISAVRAALSNLFSGVGVSSSG